ncbi:MAG: hypothetical protein U1E04_14675 [Hylemonella sp.]|nr:hypothetical protein [Hylemonella sp.]
MAWNEIAFVVLVAVAFLLLVFAHGLFELGMDLLFDRKRFALDKRRLKRDLTLAGIAVVLGGIAFQYI